MEVSKKQRVLKLKEYDEDRKDLERVVEVGERLDDVLWLNVNGEVEITGRELIVGRVMNVTDFNAIHSNPNPPSTR